MSEAKQCPDLFIQVFSDCAIASFAVRVVTWDDSSANVFVNSATDVLLDCVLIARFASYMVWSCCISVKNAVLACADCTLAAYPLVFEVLDDLCVYLNTLAK